METTSATLLERVRDRSDAAAWRDFNAIYRPLLTRYALRRGVSRTDAEEIAQECMKDLARAMPGFAYSRSRGRFKSYLKTVADHCIERFLRRVRPAPASPSRIARVAAPEEPSDLWDKVWLREHLLYCLGILESKSVDHTVRAFRLYALEDWPVEKVCRTLDMTPNQVYLAKSRMTRRLRRAMQRSVGELL